MYISYCCMHRQWWTWFVAIFAPGQAVFCRWWGAFCCLFTTPYSFFMCKAVEIVCIKTEKKKKLNGGCVLLRLVIPSYFKAPSPAQASLRGSWRRRGGRRSRFLSPEADLPFVHLWMCMKILVTSHLSFFFLFFFKVSCRQKHFDIP